VPGETVVGVFPGDFCAPPLDPLLESLNPESPPGSRSTLRTPVIRRPATAAASSARRRASASAARVASVRPADGSAKPNSGSPIESAPADATASISGASPATVRTWMTIVCCAR
jgi:hypothetical protein